MGYYQLEGALWACSLVTCEDAEGGCRGHLLFEPREPADGRGEIRTTEIFLEPTEREVRVRALALGRRLITALLGSALHVSRRAAPAVDGLDRPPGPDLP